MSRIIKTMVFLLAAFGLPGSAAVWADTLQDVRDRAALRCGVGASHEGFARADESGKWTGFDIDYCRAVAAAALGDTAAVEFVALDDKQRFRALRNGDVDLLSRHSAWTMSRDTSLGLVFAVSNYLDDQSFMVATELGLTSPKELSGTPICVLAGTRAELNMARFFAANAMAYNPVAFERRDEAIAAYESGRCGAFTDDASALYADLRQLAEPRNHAILKEGIAQRPLGLVVREGDDRWLRLVRWVHHALVNAEVLGVRTDNVDDMLEAQDQAVRVLLGSDGSVGEEIGLTPGWAAAVVRQVGNYAEVFGRNLGEHSDYGMARGLNALWRDGGLLMSPPLR